MKHSPLATQDDLFHRVLEGAASDADLEHLRRLLIEEQGARDDWIRLTHLHAELATGALLEFAAEAAHTADRTAQPGASDLRPPGTAASPRTAPPWRRRFGRMAAALGVGLLLGGFGTSLLRAVIEPRAGKMANLLADSFESQVSPRIEGPPEDAGVWGGDVTELVSERDGVRPRSGRQMLRFVSAAFEGKVRNSDSYIADLHRLMDMRPFARELAAGDVTLRFIAHLNAHAHPERVPYTVGIYLHAITHETLRKNALQRPVHELVQESLGVSVSNTPLDRDPNTWQAAAAELRLPPQTEFVWMHITLTHPEGLSGGGPRSFSGHYLDDVEVVLMRRPPRP